MLNVLCVYFVFLSQRYLCSVMLIIPYIVYRVLSLSVNPMLHTHIKLSKQRRLCLHKNIRNCQGTCRPNFQQFAETLKFTKMTPKFGENWFMKCIVVFSFWGASPPRPPDQGLCPWTPLGTQPPDPHYRLALPRSP